MDNFGILSRYKQHTYFKELKTQHFLNQAVVKFLSFYLERKACISNPIPYAVFQIST